MEQLLKYLGIDQLCVAGLSGGGPHALACALTLGDRIRRTAVISTVGTLDAESLAQMHPDRRRGLALARRAPWLLPIVMRLRNDPRKVERQYEQAKARSPSDRPVLERPEIRAMLMESWAEANHRGLRGYAQEGGLLAKPWGFDPAEIRGSVGLWHGTEDASIPIRMSRRLAAEIPNATLHEIPNAADFLFFDHLREIVSWLLQLGSLAEV